jgi:DNA-binding CsgD family transcriptional regulator
MEARASDVLVGRARELEELDRVLATACAGRGSTVLIAGDAGIGKTRLTFELSRRARDAGFELLLGRSIDLVGTELPYQPFVEALRPLGDPRQVDAPERGSQLRVFETTLDLLVGRAASNPILLVLEDLHWADVSTLDLVVFLAHNVDDSPILLIATYRADDPASTARMRRLADGVRRSGSSLVLELGPLEREELAELLEARADHPLSEALTDAIAVRSEGNPFLAEELLAAAGEQSVALPPGLRDLLLQRVTRLDDRTQDVLRLASAAGRNVGYSLLRATVELTDSDLRDSLRAAVEGGVLLAEPETSSFRFRHALLAEAIYATILPGEREQLHARLAEELVRSGAAGAAELASHWAAASRTAEALAASVEGARQAEVVFGLAEALAHLERALALWDAVADATELTGLRLAELCSWAAELASRRGAAQRAVELGRRAIELVSADDPHRAALLHVRLGEYLHETGNNEAGLAALERAVALAPAEPPSPERAYALASLAGGLMVAWRYAESLPISEHALALAREVGAGEAEVRALTVLGGDFAYLGRSEEGLAYFRQALQLAEEIGDHFGLERAYGNLTDALMMLGRPRESARVGERGLEKVRRYGIHSSLLVANGIEALLAIGEWDAADRASAAAVRALTADSPHVLLMLRADCELGRGDFESARAHLEDALATLREDHWQGIYDVFLAELALWERRWTDADQAVSDSLAMARSRETSQLRVWFCAKGLRAQAELAAIARARRDSNDLRYRLGRARALLAAARGAAAEASAITPNTDAWRMVAEAEYKRARGRVEPQLWADAAATWDELERPPLASYCRWREAEALVAAGASRAAAGAPLRNAYAVAKRLGAKPLLQELELLAQRARLDLTAPETGSREQESLGESLGLTPREAEVLSLVARGYTNREIADTLVISIRTAGVHVSHILRKLEAPNRREAAAIAHRFAAPVARRRDG